MSEQSKVLILDIETWPIVADVWGTKDQFIALNQIKKDWSVMALGAKWLGAPATEVMYKDVRNQKDLRDDKALLQWVWKLLDEADIVITQNGEAFDGPKLNARFIFHGMNPPSPYKHIDTYRIVRRVAGFTSNKLEYLTDKLCTKYKKLHHQKFPGMSLWHECEKGNKAAWKEMQTYNINDVLSTEELYLKLRSWAPDSMPDIHHDNGVCKVCGSANIKKNGTRRNRTVLYQQLVCNDCGRWQKGEKVK